MYVEIKVKDYVKKRRRQKKREEERDTKRQNEK